jgi:hypothetical protein
VRAQVLTLESVQALASYLAERQRLHASGANPRSTRCGVLVEVGAGDGRLSHFLNATGLLSPPILATDPKPLSYARVILGARPSTAASCSSAGADVTGAGSSTGATAAGAGCCEGSVEEMDDAQALAAYAPALVLCSFMNVAQDWAERWRTHGVEEYVLIGTLGSGSGGYVSLNDMAPAGYSRHLLEDVSSALLDAHAVPRDSKAAAFPSALCAVSFRRNA